MVMGHSSSKGGMYETCSGPTGPHRTAHHSGDSADVSQLHTVLKHLPHRNGRESVGTGSQRRRLHR